MRSIKHEPMDDQSRWRYGAMLGLGYFGSDTPEGRRHRNRCFAWLAVFMVTGVGAAIHSLPDPVRLGITAQLVTALHVNARAATAIMPILMLAVILLAEMLRGVTLALLARSRR